MINRNIAFDDPVAFRVNDAARMIGISRSKLYSLARQQRLEIRKLDGRSVVPKTSLDTLMAALPRLHG